MSGGSMNSPFRYAGGKFYARKLILEHIPAHSGYCEPLAGGASIFFAKPKAQDNWLNDRDTDLMRVYRRFRDARSQRTDDLLDSRSSVGEVMTTRLVTIRAHETIDTAIELLATGEVHSALVLDREDRLVGIVTDTDILDYLCS